MDAQKRKYDLIDQAMWLGFLLIIMLIVGVISVYCGMVEQNTHQDCCKYAVTK